MYPRGGKNIQGVKIDCYTYTNRFMLYMYKYKNVKNKKCVFKLFKSCTLGIKIYFKIIPYNTVATCKNDPRGLNDNE